MFSSKYKRMVSIILCVGMIFTSNSFAVLSEGVGEVVSESIKNNTPSKNYYDTIDEGNAENKTDSKNAGVSNFNVGKDELEEDKPAEDKSEENKIAEMHTGVDVSISLRNKEVIIIATEYAMNIQFEVNYLLN